MSSPDYFSSDPDWEAFASKEGYPLPSNTTPPFLDEIEPMEMDAKAARAGQAISDEEWSATHPLEAVGYVSRLTTIKVRDGTEVSVKISYPSSARLRAKGKTALPVLFVSHGGGWVQGTHISEEAWVLWPLYEHFELVIVSVEYRLAPEHQYPVWIEDSWDALSKLFSPNESIFSGLDVELDLKTVILAGSSSGGGISAVLSQMCRNKGIPISGVILNVPVLCDYRHFPPNYASDGHPSSYRQCADTFSSGAMIWVWNQVLPSPTSGSDPRASPLLGDCANLPRHLIFVAGQDALRDEGIAYAANLKESGVPVELKIYKGVPHHFAQISELTVTTRFREDLKAALGQWLRVT